MGQSNADSSCRTDSTVESNPVDQNANVDEIEMAFEPSDWSGATLLPSMGQSNADSSCRTDSTFESNPVDQNANVDEIEMAFEPSDWIAA